MPELLLCLRSSPRDTVTETGTPLPEVAYFFLLFACVSDPPQIDQRKRTLKPGGTILVRARLELLGFVDADYERSTTGYICVQLVFRDCVIPIYTPAH